MRKVGPDSIAPRGDHPRTQKAHAPKCVGFLVILVGRAGLEPATNGLKIAGSVRTTFINQ
jgi:hypothetical protein